MNNENYKDALRKRGYTEDQIAQEFEKFKLVGADAYVFTYNAPVELYDQFAADVAEMIDSFGAGTAAQKAESSSLWAEPAATRSQAEADQMEENTSVTS